MPFTAVLFDIPLKRLFLHAGMNSFDELYQAHVRAIFNLALHYLRSKEDAEEITQDVFVVAYRHWEDFRGEASVRTWLYRITINRCLDMLKSQKRKQRWAQFIRLFQQESDAHHPWEKQHPGAILEQAEEVNRILAWIDQLPEQQRTAIILLKIECLSQREAAAIMNIHEKAFESLVYRAKQQIEKKWKENEGK